MNRIMVLVAIVLLLVPLTALGQDFCKGNFDYDKDVDGSDASTFKQDFGRSALLDPCPSDGPAPVEKTWQNTSYAIGDDGYYQRGVEWSIYRYTDNGDGTVTDNLTGLIWLKNANCWGTLPWDQALTYTNGLLSGQCGLTDLSNPGDWRMPNVKEMTSLIDYNSYAPAVWWSYFFYNVEPAHYYWSSTTYASVNGNVWLVYMHDGVVTPGAKGGWHNVWPVRGGHPY